MLAISAGPISRIGRRRVIDPQQLVPAAVPAPSSSLLAEAFRLHQTGELEPARAAYEAFLREQPNDPAALNNLGALQLQVADYAGAIETLEKLGRLRPADPVLRCNLGRALIAAGRPQEAVGPLRAAIEQQPDYVDAHDNLGLALMAIGDSRQAETHLRMAVDLDPRRAQTISTLCDLWLKDGDLDSPLELLQRIVAQDPLHDGALFKLGYVQMLSGDVANASAAFQRVTELQPAYAPTYLNLAELARMQKNPAVAESHLRHALSLRPDYREAKENLGYVLFAQGRYREAWPLLEVRQGGTAARKPKRFAHIPIWDGRVDPQAILLVYPELGLGDTMQFSRFVRLARRRVGRLLLAVDGYWRPLRRLMESLEGVDEIVDAAARNVKISAYCQLLSLPYLLDLDEPDMRIGAAYLAPKPEDVRKWAQRIPAADAPKVGLAWAGNPRPELEHWQFTDRRRSLNLALLAPIVELPGVQFFSLQKGDPGAQIAANGMAARIVDYTADLHDMAETAALIAQLDLVITTDTAIVHLAGAMGKPVWMLNSFESDWRWGPDSTDSVWYPTLRIFHQRSIGDWGPVVATVKEQLQERRRSGPPRD